MKSAEKNLNIFPIRYVSQRTELSTHLIRVWEKRYRAVVPKRTESNRRLFSEADVKRLQLLKQAVEAGHSISQISDLSSEALIRLINANLPEAGSDQVNPQKSHKAAYYLDLTVSHVIGLDADGLESALDQAAVHLTKVELINSVIAPLYMRIGELWRQGELKIIYEHLATPIIQSFLWRLLRSIKASRLAPRIVIATPVNHRHELGALALGIHARESGWRSLYFGSSLPADEIAAAVSFSEARAVALSITFSHDGHHLITEIKKLRRYLSDDIVILIGGQAASTVRDGLARVDVRFLDSLENFQLALDTMRNRQK